MLALDLCTYIVLLRLYKQKQVLLRTANMLEANKNLTPLHLVQRPGSTRYLKQSSLCVL